MLYTKPELRNAATRLYLPFAGHDYLGASSMYAWQFTQALYLAECHGWMRLVSMQNLCNLTYREEEREMLPLWRDQGIGVIPGGPSQAASWLAGLSANPKPKLRPPVRWDPLHTYSSDNNFVVAEGLARLADR